MPELSQLKKVTAIFFAGLVLFNALGMYGLLIGIQYQSGRSLDSRLDRDQYNINDAITIKFPMSLPYHIDNGVYHRVEGKVQHQGEFYRLVKQKLEKDTLYIVCVRDHDGKRIADALSDYVKTYADTPSSSKSLIKSFSIIKDFLATVTTLQSACDGWFHDVEFTSATAIYSSIPAKHASPPPRA